VLASRYDDRLDDVSQATAGDAQEAVQPRRLALEWILFAVYAFMIAVGALGHAMFRDEAQAWLIARDSHNLAELVHNLRYEGHPVLWYLLLYVPAHFSWNPVSAVMMQAFLACLGGALVITMRRLPLWMRGLTLFSSYFLYDAGIIARNYMIAMVLLMLAAHFLLAEQRRLWLGAVALALTIQAHFLAIPVAVSLFLWLILIPLQRNAGGWPRLMRSPRFLGTSAIIAASLAGAYFTIRPPADVAGPRSAREGQFRSNSRNLMLAEENAVQVMIPVRDLIEAGVPKVFFHTKHLSRQQDAAGALVADQGRVSGLAPVHPQAAALSALVLLAVFFALRTWTARTFLAVSLALSFQALAATLGFPLETRYLSFCFLAVLLSFLIDASVRPAAVPLRLPTWAAAAMIAALTLQAISGLWLWTQCLTRPYSDSRETSRWVRAHGLAANPLLLENEALASAVVAYLERPHAYGAECHCNASFVLWKKATAERQSPALSGQDLSAARAGSQLPVVLIASRPLSTDEEDKLSLRFIHDGAPNPVVDTERFFVYEQEGSFRP
jgi:hypothetical protein